MKLGTNDIGSVYLGTNAVQSVYLGTNLVYSAFSGGLLDTYTGAAAAYSLRRLSSSYTGKAIKVRRSVGSPTEKDIGFVGENLDVADLESFCSGTDGFVVTWYDQSGNARDATQTTAANQPQIVSSGSLILENAKPILDFNTNKSLQLNNSHDFISASCIYTLSNGSNLNMITTNFPTDNNYYIFLSNTTISFDGLLTDEARYSLNGSLLSAYAENHSGTFAINTQFHNYFNYDASRSMKSILRSIGNYDSFDIDFQGKIQELVFWNSDNSSSVSGINTNINDFYSIY